MLASPSPKEPASTGPAGPCRPPALPHHRPSLPPPQALAPSPPPQGWGASQRAQIVSPPQHKQPLSPPGEPQLGQRNYGPPRGDSGNPLRSGLDSLRPVRLHDGEGPEGKYSDPDTLGPQSPPLNSQKAPGIPDGAVQSPSDTCTNAKVTAWFGFGKQSISILDVSRLPLGGPCVCCIRVGACLPWGNPAEARGPEPRDRAPTGTCTASQTCIFLRRFFGGRAK